MRLMVRATRCTDSATVYYYFFSSAAFLTLAHAFYLVQLVRECGMTQAWELAVKAAVVKSEAEEVCVAWAEDNSFAMDLLHVAPNDTRSKCSCPLVS